MGRRGWCIDASHVNVQSNNQSIIISPESFFHFWLYRKDGEPCFIRSGYRQLCYRMSEMFDRYCIITGKTCEANDD